MIDDATKHMMDAIDKREADLIKESKANKQTKTNKDWRLEAEKRMTKQINNDGSDFPAIMGEKEFFDVMKNANRFLRMEERFLIAELIHTFTERRRQDEANGAI
tara:strand:- start:13921 stop:14232 length:312 start_codon:yes stop_codon:yes gene_type:complete